MIFSIIISIISVFTAVISLIISGKNAKPRIQLEVLNEDPFCIATGKHYVRNFFKLSEKSNHALINVEIQNASAMSGTITDIFVVYKQTPCQVQASYKDYRDPFVYKVTTELMDVWYNDKYQNLQQPIVVPPFSYLTGFLFVPFFDISTDETCITVYLEYRVVGFSKLYRKKIVLYKAK